MSFPKGRKNRSRRRNEKTQLLNVGNENDSLLGSGQSTDNNAGYIAGLIMLGLVSVGLLVGVIVLAVRGAPEPELVPSTNVYTGLGDDGYGLDNTRNAAGNKYLNSSSIQNLQLRCKFDVSTLSDSIGTTFGGRMNGGPLGTSQADEDRFYFMLGNTQPIGTGFGSDLDPITYLFALNRNDCSVAWVVDWPTMSTQAVRRLATKYPDQYDVAAANAFTRADDMGGSFAPITLVDGMIITGDGSPSEEFYSTDYFASLPQANGGPVVGRSFGVTNTNRHILRNGVWVINAATGVLMDVDKLADNGYDRTPGNVNVYGAMRMATAYRDPKDNQLYAVVPQTNIPPGAWNPQHWRGVDDLVQRNAAIANGNFLVTTSKVKLYHISGTGQLTERWVVYGHPPLKKAGDPHPYAGLANIITGAPNPTTFATDLEADDYNYMHDGFWGQRPLVDIERRQVVMGAGNPTQMPKEDIRTAYTLDGTTPSSDTLTGAQSFPNENHNYWIKRNSEATSYEEIQSYWRDWRLTQEDRVRALLANPRSEFKDFAGNSMTAFDMDNGDVKWRYTSIPVDNLLTGYSIDNVGDWTEFMKWRQASFFGDYDFGSGATRYRDPVTGEDTYYCSPQDGRICFSQP